ncbi:MAG: SNF2-related protein, partial [Bacteroidales bacterium]
KTRVAIDLVNSATDIDLVVWIAPLQTIKPKDNLPSIKGEIKKWGGFNVDTIYCGIESIGASDRIYLNLRSEISNAKNPFIIVDESLKIKNYEAKRTKRALDLSQMANYKLILNGTPLSKNLLDIWAQMEFLSPKILNMSLAQFKNVFCKYKTITKYFGGRKSYSREFIEGYENIDYLYSLIRHYVFECDLSLNVSQYYNELRYIVGEKEQEQYTFLKEKYLDDKMLQWKNNNIFLEMTQKMQHVYSCTEDKFNVVDNLFKNIPQDKTIIYCKYISSQEACRERYPKAQVLSYQKESLGLNLQNYRNTVYFDKTWDFALRTQSSRRTFRTGQEYDCRYWDLTGNVGLESLIDTNIAKKISMTEYFKKISKAELKINL